MSINSAEIVFIKSVKDGIPNRDPLNDSNARRIFGEDDGRISLSDVSIKRDVRDYIMAKYPDGGPDNRNFIYVREERTEDGKLLGRGSLASKIEERSGIKASRMQDLLTTAAFDVRAFGIVYSVKKETFKLTGPVQFGWAHSLHPIESQFIQGTVVMPSQDIGVTTAEGQESKGLGQGTIWTTYIVPFAIFAMPGIINASIAQETGLTSNDVDLLLEGLWNGTKHRQARGRGIQQPLFLIHVEYKAPMYRIGYIEESIKLRVEDNTDAPTSLGDSKLDLTALARLLKDNQEKIARIRYWSDSRVTLLGELEGEKCSDW
ncbi:MAG TPA: type I CRISPR-associated protein Cas7 [Bacteroidales bacterium]|nr:type I CRISPR-associated protein Cas7 [Bacteroidales bacterium]